MTQEGLNQEIMTAARQERGKLVSGPEGSGENVKSSQELELMSRPKKRMDGLV